jgi:hypothetical protein
MLTARQTVCIRQRPEEFLYCAIFLPIVPDANVPLWVLPPRIQLHVHISFTISRVSTKSGQNRGNLPWPRSRFSAWFAERPHYPIQMGTGLGERYMAVRSRMFRPHG